jgi:hypothetical protein
MPTFLYLSGEVIQSTKGFWEEFEMKTKIALSLATLAAFAIVPVASMGTSFAADEGGGGGGDSVCDGHGGVYDIFDQEVTRGGSVYLVTIVQCNDGTQVEINSDYLGPVGFCY